MTTKLRKFSSVGAVRNQITKRQLEMELALMESAWDSSYALSNPEESYLDPVTGESWIPLGPMTNDYNAAPFRNEAELNTIRRTARISALKNPYAKNLLNSITAFTVGKGHKYTAVMQEGISEEDEDTARRVAKKVQKFLDRLLKMNNWPKRQRQSVYRYHRDGEVFIRLFFQEDGYTLFRFIEPADVYTPAQHSGPNTTFGIKNSPGDVESTVGLWAGGEWVPAEDFQHRKANVDFNMKRGLSTLFTIRDHLDRALKLLRNMSVTVANQTAISAIRKHKATKGQVQSFAARAVTSTRQTLTGETINRHQNPVGATVDLIDGKTSYEFPAGGLNAASPVQVLAAELRAIAASLSWPEFMIGSDSSNANYSSTMVAENPAVKSIEMEQADHIADDLELLWASVEHAVQTGYLPAEALTLVEIEVEPPTIVSRDPKIKAETDQILNLLRVKSPQTICGENSLDYKQEQRNFTEHEDSNLDADPLGGPLPPEVGSGPSPGVDGGVAATALNGAQITGLVTILTAAAQGQIPLDSVAAVIVASFPMLSAEQVADMVNPLQGFKAAPAPSKTLAA